MSRPVPGELLAAVYFMDRRFFRGVMFPGRMEVCEDAETKEMIWQPGDTEYYPLGVTDPDCCVLRFTAQDGRYYSNFASKHFRIPGPDPLDGGSDE